jgi:uncharacterized repeat protein (TIGR01451 family)
MCAFNKSLKRLLATGLVAFFGVVYSTSALAVGTDAGTAIDNAATVGYKVGGVSQTAVPSNTTSFVVDQVVDLTVVEADGSDTVVGAGQQDAVARFTVTNTGNATQDFALTVADLVGGPDVLGNTDTIDTDALTIFVDANGNDVYDAGVDTAGFIDALVADGTVSVFVLGDIPSGAAAGAAANIELTATAHQTGTADVLDPPQTETGIDDDPATVQVVFSNNTDSDQDSYRVGLATLAVAKASEVISDPVAGVSTAALAIPGAIVEYEVTITNTGILPATEVVITDDIQADLTFETGTYNGAAADVEITVGADPAVYCIAELTADSNGDGCFRDAAGDSLTVSIPVSVSYPSGLLVDTTAPDNVVVIKFQVSIN